MARTRGDSGPPGLGGVPNGENPMSEPQIAPSDREEHVPWSGRGEIVEHSVPPDALGERLETLWNELVNQNGVIEQLTNQLHSFERKAAEFWTACEEQRNAIIMLQQRLDALARQQLQTNTRIAAVQLAVQARGPHDKADAIRDSAETFYQFLMRDLITSVSSPPSETQH
ncbi:MAG: hypothetical protein C5B60_05165 [Chloroflexi bacterium]|nr:MAG: hypothetical protein C5B60_05165 [Chloroflexota bacterium]